jgi:hypothetical protein
MDPSRSSLTSAIQRLGKYSPLIHSTFESNAHFKAEVIGDHFAAAESRSISASELQVTRVAKLKEKIEIHTCRKYPLVSLLNAFLCRAVRECIVKDSPKFEGSKACEGPGLRTGELIVIIAASLVTGKTSFSSKL